MYSDFLSLNRWRRLMKGTTYVLLLFGKLWSFWIWGFSIFTENSGRPRIVIWRRRRSMAVAKQRLMTHCPLVRKWCTCQHQKKDRQRVGGGLAIDAHVMKCKESKDWGSWKITPTAVATFHDRNVSRPQHFVITVFHDRSISWSQSFTIAAWHELDACSMLVWNCSKCSWTAFSAKRRSFLKIHVDKHEAQKLPCPLTSLQADVRSIEQSLGCLQSAAIFFGH